MLDFKGAHRTSRSVSSPGLPHVTARSVSSGVKNRMSPQRMKTSRSNGMAWKNKQIKSFFVFFFLSWLFCSLNFNRSNWKLVFLQGLEQLQNRFTIVRRSSNAWLKDLSGWSTACTYVSAATPSKKMHIVLFASTFKDRMTPYRYKLCCRMRRARKAKVNIVFHFIFALD